MSDKSDYAFAIEKRHGAMSMRGYAAIGLVSPKHAVNVGQVIRAAGCYGAAMIALEGRRVDVRACTDTMKMYRHIPVIRGDDLHEMIPFDCVPVAVDLVDGAESLTSFQHPRSAFYVFGPEDSTLGKRHLDWCAKRVMIPMRGCSNLAATVNVVLYDRMAKHDRQTRGISNTSLVEAA
jgi:tRNA(Leu) C34 or U34 (ribose-2'-O)-methylase TrmL